MQTPLIAATLLATLFILPVGAQETRSAIFGRVSDAQGAAVPDATLEVTNTGTNVAIAVHANETGYFEANLLIAGNYRVTAEKPGFRKLIRSGIVLPMGTRLELNPTLEVGEVSQTLEVTAAATLVDTNASATAGRVMGTREVLDLPTFNNSPLMLIKLAPGIQASGNRRYNGVNALGGTGEAHNVGNVGGNDWSIDGAPNMGTGYQAASLPYSTTIAEYQVATQNFDAAVGHSSGAAISIMTKGGTNDFHGDITEQYWNSRWNGALFVVRQSHYRAIAAAEAAGNHALADQLRNSPVNPPGHSNTYAATVGGPVIVPKLLNGRNKLFFFFSFDGFKDNKITENNPNHNVPTMPERSGDFSDLLAVSSAKYQLYDPLSVRPDPSRPGHYVRDPIVGNLIPANRMTNPIYKTYLGFEPPPNNLPGSPSLEPLNDYVGATEPRNWMYWALSNRIDYNISNKHRFFGRWSYFKYREDTLDWTYEIKRRLMTYGFNRNNLSGTGNWTFTPKPSMVVDLTLSANNYSEGNILSEVALGYTPGSVGLPAYLDAKAGANHAVPVLTWSTYTGAKAYETLGQSVPGWNRYQVYAIKSNLTYIRGSHTMRAGIDTREHRRAGGDPGRTGGAYDFSTNYTCQQDDCLTAGTLGHSYAAFEMGLPTTSTIDTNDTYYVAVPYVGAYAQDNWRISSKLSLNIGLRTEYEFGFNERYNRFIGGFDPTATLPITALAQAAYAKSPVPELSASAFSVLGGTYYPGTGNAGRRFPAGQLMFLPRIGFSYELTSRSVLRGGYGIYYDTLNPNNRTPDQSGFSQPTIVSSSTDFGQTWVSGNPRNGVSPVTDPFPVRSDGTRYDQALGAAYGTLATTGVGWTVLDPNFQRAREQRWRLDFQHQWASGFALSIGYSGMYASDVRLTKKVDALPSQYWNLTSTRNNDLATNLNANVANPFYIGNFASLQTSGPALYQALASRAFFKSPTIRKNQLLRPFSQMNGLSEVGGFGATRSHSVEAVARRSFAHGFLLDVNFTLLRERDRDFYWNEFDPQPTWELSNNGVPWRFAATGIWQLPFGKGKPLATGGIGNAVLGGWQISGAYENQPGPLLNWGNLFYNGDPNNICGGWSQTLDSWFNTAGFVTAPALQPAAFQARVFPRRIGNCRADGLNRLDANIQRIFRIRDRFSFQMRLDALNVANHSQMDVPDVGPTSSNLGKVTSNTTSTARFLLIQGRLSF